LVRDVHVDRSECIVPGGDLVDQMTDAVYILVIVGFFALTAGYAYACGRL
jgi:hypothetical protein